LELADNLNASPQDSGNTDLLEGFIIVRNDNTSGIGSYILKRYLTNKAINVKLCTLGKNYSGAVKRY